MEPESGRRVNQTFAGARSSIFEHAPTAERDAVLEAGAFNESAAIERTVYRDAVAAPSRSLTSANDLARHDGGPTKSPPTHQPPAATRASVDRVFAASPVSDEACFLPR
ncbi:MAG: hypothetical protein BGO98_29790 [Myxococcales bacterium 68-20]|nr:MAG: hypothetical protein BGO98_29790 [Myxococcales bacterium 68-20]